MARTPHFGHVPGFPPGSTFEDRVELSKSGVHRPPQHGICGTGARGAESIVVSGGYPDDEDSGSHILYTGAGGRDPSSKRQVRPQKLTAQNLSLVTSMRLGLPVRVIRGAHPEVFNRPDSGYRYDGLYRVADYWPDEGRDGFRIWRFRLERLADDEATSGRVSEELGLFEAIGPASRRDALVSRIVRDTAVTREVKRLYDYRCQVCDERIETPTGPYAEAAHITPLGRPHDGPDTLANVLCLCPTHHAGFDLYALAVDNDLGLIGMPGRLTLRPGHGLSRAALREHRLRYQAVQETGT